MIGNVMHYFGMSWKEVTQELSYANIVLLNAAIPGMEPFEERKEKRENEKAEKINAKQLIELWQQEKSAN